MQRSPSPSIATAGTLLAGLLTGLCLCAAAVAGTPTETEQPGDHGFRVTKVRLSAANHMVDVRYRVDDPDAAWPLLRGATLVLEHEASHHRLNVPSTAFIGPLAQNAEKPKKDRQYFILFANQGGLVKAGDTVRLHIGKIAFGPFVVGGEGKRDDGTAEPDEAAGADPTQSPTADAG